MNKCSHGQWLHVSTNGAIYPLMVTSLVLECIRIAITQVAKGPFNHLEVGLKHFY